jgi:hypothetical protein
MNEYHLDSFSNIFLSLSILHMSFDVNFLSLKVFSSFLDLILTMLNNCMDYA